MRGEGGAERDDDNNTKWPVVVEFPQWPGRSVRPSSRGPSLKNNQLSAINAFLCRCVASKPCSQLGHIECGPLSDSRERN